MAVIKLQPPGVECIRTPTRADQTAEQEADLIAERARQIASGDTFDTCECGELFEHWHELDCQIIATQFVPAPLRADGRPRIVRLPLTSQES